MIGKDDLPIFIQIKEKIKDDILSGVYKADELIISTTQISKLYKVNPATAVKSVSVLTDEGIVYKKRGIGMCVSKEAKDMIYKQREESFFNDIITSTINEAKKIGLKKEELINLIMEVKNYD